MKSRGLAILTCGFVLLSGCSTWNVLGLRADKPEEPVEEAAEIGLVGDLAVPFGINSTPIESVGLVTGLKGTGSDPRPSPQRDALLAEMKTRGVVLPNAILSSGNTSLVLVRGYLRPGIQKGDRFDVEVRVPSQSETTSLRGGHLLECSLKELAVLDNAIHPGFDLGKAVGPVLVDPSASDKNSKSDRLLMCRGRVLSGGVCFKSRPLQLVIRKPDDRTVYNSARIEQAINRRLHTYEKGVKVGMAKALTDEYIDLKVHPRYKDNVQRYLAVLRSISLKDSETERMDRLKVLEKQLQDPITASRASLELEAIGKQGIEILLKGIRAEDREVRFYAAESLAYLDESQAAKPLAEAARDMPAFRVFALTALSAMNDFAASEQLRELLAVPSAETRYGAFRALWAMKTDDALVRGEAMSGRFSYHILENAGPPMIHVTRSRRPEVVLFGRDQRLKTPLALEAGNRIMVTSDGGDEVVVSKFAPNEPDQKRVVSTQVDDVIRTIVELGGAYPDVVQALQQAKSSGVLLSRFEVDALPHSGRLYDRAIAADSSKKGKSESENDAGRDGPVANSPVPDLYTTPTGKASDDDTVSRKSEFEEVSPGPEDKPGPVKAFFAKMRGEKEEKEKKEE